MTKADVRAGAANQDVQQLLERWGVPIDPELLVLALTHRSFANEQGGIPNNERLEFLGDSVLSIIITDDLFTRFPELPESGLSKRRASIVSQTPLAEAAQQLGLGEYVLLGVGERKTGGMRKPSILSDTFEALIGATYLSRGLEQTRTVVLRHLSSALEESEGQGSGYDWKTPLTKLLKPARQGDITFTVVGVGPDHDKHYEAQVHWQGDTLGVGAGSSKKSAENDAAKAAYFAFTERNDA